MMRFNNTDMALFGIDPYYREFKFEKWEELGPKLKEYFESGENDIDWHLQESLICYEGCLLYTAPSPRDKRQSRMPSSA